MTSPKKLLFPVALAALFLLPSATAVAQNPGPASAGPGLSAPGAEASDAEREAYWRMRAREARDRVAAARERVAESDADYTRMRTRNQKRGDAKGQVVQDQSSAHAELEAALRYLEVDLPEEARRAGALPGWLRE